MRTKRLIVTFILVVLFCNLFSYIAFTSSVNIAINGKYIQFNSSSGEPFIDNAGRTQVPLRAAMEAFGCKVSWDDKTHTASVSKNGTTVNIPIGKNYILKNGITIPNDTIAQIKNSRTYLPIRAVFEAFGAYVSWDNKLNCVNVSTASPLMQVIFMDIGQGDSALVDFGNYEILIDAADNNYGYDVVNSIKPYVDGNLELVIATHPDADHIGGMDDVLENYSVNRIIDSGYKAETKTFNDYINSVQKENCIFEYDSDITIDIGNGAYIKIIETGDNWDNSNDMSVVTELVYGNTKVLFTGDISSTVEENSISKFNNIDVLKLAHHGSKSSTSNSFLNVTKPQYAVVSADSNNKYGHPTSDALQRLFNSNTKVLGTFKSGNIILNINSDTFSFNKSNYLTLNDAGDKNISQSVSSNNITNETNYSYIGNKNTKKFHFSYCSSAQKINDNNKIYFVSRNNALQSGFIACKVCNP